MGGQSAPKQQFLRCPKTNDSLFPLSKPKIAEQENYTRQIESNTNLALPGQFRAGASLIITLRKFCRAFDCHLGSILMPAPFQGAVRSGPLVLLRLEGAATFGVLLAAYAWSGHSWWLFAALFFMPDLSILAYLANARLGATAYNAVHSTIGPVLVGAGGLLFDNLYFPWFAVIWAAHIGFDRMLGYGLKYASGFKDTHLGSPAAPESGYQPASRFRVSG